jgi:hypothetical protein
VVGTSVLTFIDFKKAFYTIHRGKMIKILLAYGIPDSLKQLMTHIRIPRQKLQLLMVRQRSLAYLPLRVYVLQGDTLAPYLFIIVLDYCLRVAIAGREESVGFTIKPRQSRRVGPLMITDLDFADDIALLSNTAVQEQEFLEKLESTALHVGLHMNANKTNQIHGI